MRAARRFAHAQEFLATPNGRCLSRVAVDELDEGRFGSAPGTVDDNTKDTSGKKCPPRRGGGTPTHGFLLPTRERARGEPEEEEEEEEEEEKEYQQPPPRPRPHAMMTTTTTTSSPMKRRIRRPGLLLVAVACAAGGRVVLMALSLCRRSPPRGRPLSSIAHDGATAEHRGGGSGLPALLSSIPQPSMLSLDRLRLDYTNLLDGVRSPMAQLWQRHQNDCALPVANFRYRNRYGLGSDLHVWTQALCNAVQRNVRIRTEFPWIYVDENACRMPEMTNRTVSSGAVPGLIPSHRTAMTCYFSRAEPRCPNDESGEDINGNGKGNASLLGTFRRRPDNLYTGNGMVSRGECRDVMEKYNASLADVRASGVEFLFASVSPLVVDEARRHLSVLFDDAGKGGGGGNNQKRRRQRLPSLLVTVHIRWGDKRREDRPRPLREYVDAVHALVRERRRRTTGPASLGVDDDDNDNGDNVGIFLATEDPAAVEQFQQEADKHQWRVYVDVYYQEFSPNRDGTYNGNPRMAQTLHGRPGLVALASLLVALQANDFVLTTTSNWSRLLNELRKNVLDPRCGNCTRMVDLSPGEW